VALVDKGEIEGISDGEAAITAYYQGLEISFKVYVTTSEEEEKEIEVLQIQDKNIKLLVNEEKSLKVNAMFSDGSQEDYTDQVSWTSSKNSVVEVEDSVLIANSIGSATITASFNGIEATLKVEVKKDKELKSLVASSKKVTLKRGEELDVAITAYYKDGTKRIVSELADWKVTKSGIVTVEDGVIKAGNKKGSATITAKYNGKAVNIPVTVK
jgi:hypothetical protein